MLRALFETLFKAPEPQTFTSVLELETTGKPNEAFLLPPGITLKGSASSDKLITSPAFDLPRQALFHKATAYLKDTLGGEELWRDDANQKVVYCVRTKRMRYPDMIYIQAVEGAAQDQSFLQAYSHSVVGYSDLGVNAKRLSALLQALQTDAIDKNFA